MTAPAPTRLSLRPLAYFAMPELIGVSSVDGLAVSVNLESAPGALPPDRLAVNVLIPLDVLRSLTPPWSESVNARRPWRRG